jgi:hypothetical protein
MELSASSLFNRFIPTGPPSLVLPVAGAPVAGAPQPFIALSDLNQNETLASRIKALP